MRVKLNNRKFLLMGTALVLAACSGEQAPQASNASVAPAPGSAEELLAAEGSWNIVEDKNAPTPVQEHMKARGQVDPRQLSNSKEYTKNITPEGMQEETHFRVLRLERQVTDLRDDFNKLLPPLSNLIVSDRSLDNTISDIESRQKTLADQHHAMYQGSKPPVLSNADRNPEALAGSKQVREPSRPVPPPPSYQAGERASAPKPEIVRQEPQKVAVKSGLASVTGVRLGAYPDKTRLVLDLNAGAKYSYDVDNNEKLLTIDMPGVAWTADMQKAFAGNPLIKGYTAQAANGGTTLAIELNKPAKVASSALLPPNATYNAHRIFLDIMPQ